jgi:gamma-glutamyltranspeptidase
MGTSHARRQRGPESARRPSERGVRCSRSTLTRIAQYGRDGFYTGATAQAILATEHKLGGTMTAQDLRDFHPAWVAPLHVDHRGWTVYE